MLGAPQADAPRLHDWSSWVQRQFDIQALTSQVPQMERAVTGRSTPTSRRCWPGAGPKPGDDLLTSLLAAEEAGDRLSHAECVNLVLNVIAGGIDTTQAQLSHAMRLFAAHPAQWRKLGRSARSWPGARSTRCCAPSRSPRSPPGSAWRTWSTAACTFPAGTIVAVCAERANREQDGGEDFDITAARDGRLLTFGAGPHFCLGANLARAELEEALTFLAPRMPDLAAAGPAALGGVEGIYGVESLPLRWSV